MRIYMNKTNKSKGCISIKRKYCNYAYKYIHPSKHIKGKN